MIQTRNQYLQFMLVMLAAWGISWGARFVMEQAVLLYGSGKNYLFFSHGTVLMYLLCVFLVYRRWIAPLPVVGQLRNVGVPWLVGAMAVVYVGVFLLGKALALPAEPFMTKLFADKSIPDVILTLLTIFIRHCCKVSDEAAFCLIQRPYISKTLLTRRISPRGSP